VLLELTGATSERDAHKMSFVGHEPDRKHYQVLPLMMGIDLD
jgi:hypothetical protein